ncbi:MAG: DJ-1/PfpI family protein [Gammaproteobacteria bacterium]|nr:DJ-1/PfpI family protein [Gammaproteobacteria bacterium]
MKIVALLYPQMTLLDLVGPMQVWSFLPGADVQFVWRDKGPVATDCGLPVVATHDFSDAATDPDVLFVGGGAYATLALLGQPDVLAFVAARGERAKWVTSVCTGSLILGAAGLLRGYRAACHWGAREQLTHFGAIPSDERVCIDRNRMSGGGITSGIDFGLTVAGQWAGTDTGKMLELIMEYAPEPPFGTGRPELADAATRERANALLAAAMAAPA